MKNLILPLIVLGIFIENISSQTTTSKVTRKLLVTLQQGEKILEAESCLPLGISDNQVYLVTMADKKIYVYENGQRKGPFKDTEEAGIKACNETHNDNACSAYSSEQTSPDPEYLAMTDEGQYQIKLNGKTFGPYMFIKSMRIWPDKSGFVAITMDAEMKSYLVTSDGQKTALEGDAENLRFSATGKKYVFAVKENPNFNPALLKMDFSKMTQDELLKFAKEQEEKAKQAGPPKAYVYTSNGPKLGPFDVQGFYTDNPTFTKTGGDNWIMVIDDTLYINGVLVKKFENISLSTCNIWLSKDGKRYAIISYDKILFSDGSAYNYPLKPSSSEKDGKVYLNWLSLENEKDLVSFSKEI